MRRGLTGRTRLIFTGGSYCRCRVPRSPPVALLTFLFYWNDFFGPLIYLPSEANRTLQLLLLQFRTLYTSDWGPMMAAQVMIALPPLIIFFFAQRLFIQGVVFTGIKE